MSVKKAFFWSPILFLISFSVSLVFAETILRFIYPSPKNDEVRCIEYRHSWIFNADGFRDDEFDQKLKKGKENVILLGDSFVVGLGAEKDKTFASFLSKHMDQHFEVFNLGKCDTGTVEQKKILSRYIDKIHPRAVILFFYENDIKDNFREATNPMERRIPGDQEHKQRHLVEFLEPIKPLFTKTMLYEFVRVNYRALLYKLGISKMDYTMSFELFQKNHTSPTLEQAWQYTYSALSDIKLLCQARSSTLYVVYIPLKKQINRWESVIRFYKVNPEEYDRFQLDNKLEAFCRNQRIKFLDLAKVWDVNPAKETFYYNFDKHLTPAGNQAVYDAVSPFLKDI